MLYVYIVKSINENTLGQLYYKHKTKTEFSEDFIFPQVQEQS